MRMLCRYNRLRTDYIRALSFKPANVGLAITIERGRYNRLLDHDENICISSISTLLGLRFK